MKPELIEEKIQQKSHMSEKISVDNALQMIKSNNAILIDVRESAEYLEEHIVGALNYPLGKLDPDVLTRKANGKTIIIQCLTGNRSEIACKRLHNKLSNHKKLTLDGGITAWRKAGYPIKARKNSATISLFRQIQITAGFIIIFGCVLTITLSPYFIAIPFFIGSGLLYAGISGWCGMGVLLSKMPWNQ